MFGGNQSSDKYIVENEGKFRINSGLPEFGYELIAVLPYVYYLHQNNLLEATISGYDTRPLYFFSPHHNEVNVKRSWNNVVALQDSDFPNSKIHVAKLNTHQFVPPPFKDFYKDRAILFTKPTVVICNRYNREWNGDPINFLSPDCLRQLFEVLSNNYQIVYIDTAYFNNNYADHADFIANPCETIVKEFTGRVLTLSEIVQKYPDLSINELQCRLYAGCERFISSNGGLGIFCSYFSGENIIFSKSCHELDPEVNSFYNWYGLLSGALIKVISSEDKLIELVIAKWVRQDLMYNVVIKHNTNIDLLYNAILSVLDLDYVNYNLIIDATDSSAQDVTCIYPAIISHGSSYLHRLTSTGYNLFLNLQEIISNVSVLKNISDLISKNVNDNQITSCWDLSKKTISNCYINSTSYKSKYVVIISCNSQFDYLESCLDTVVSQNNSILVQVLVAISDKTLGKYKLLTRKYIGLVDFYYTTESLSNINLIRLALHKCIYRDAFVVAISANILLPLGYIDSVHTHSKDFDSEMYIYQLPQLLVASNIKPCFYSDEVIDSIKNGESDLLQQLNYGQPNFFDVGLQALLSSRPVSVKYLVRELLHDSIRYTSLSNLQKIRSLLSTESNSLSILGRVTSFEMHTVDVSSLTLLNDILPLVGLLNISVPDSRNYLDATKIIKLSKLQ